MAHDGCLDIFLGRMKGADAAPFRGVGFEVGGGVCGAMFAYARQAPQIVLWAAASPLSSQPPPRRRPPRRRGPWRGRIPSCLPGNVPGARVAQRFQMLRHAWLALSNNFNEFADRQLRLPEQQQDAKAGRIARGAHMETSFPSDGYKGTI